MSVALTSAQNRFLRGQAHGLKALMQVGGKGITPGLVAELDELLERHELVKVKVGAEDREARDAMIADLAARTGSALVQRIGHTATLYRRSKENPAIVLPRA
ncbi:ribosome assembly RNA-binding protein YhbY [Pseudoxanthomonas suwonensis]|uniref:ribosome assembly RNA-binding protein YhbY n=1 Tax=Pseudoxanthomonas suwonensis TaxID=314722 RepID=UPI00048ED2BA|nr:ribosome assembly RNA-binding protein YhbY [Pseudoxanthomonas suwonensis]